MFPTATGINAGGIGELFHTGDLLGCQHNLGGFGSLYNVMLLGGSDDGLRPLSVSEAREAVAKAVDFYNNMRPHWSIDGVV